jgi:hypothetical protein
MLMASWATFILAPGVAVVWAVLAIVLMALAAPLLSAVRGKSGAVGKSRHDAAWGDD